MRTRVPARDGPAGAGSLEPAGSARRGSSRRGVSVADQDGVPNADMPTTATRVTLTERDGGTRMEMLSVFDTRDQMEQLMKMGMEDGLREAAGQMDGLLAG